MTIAVLNANYISSHITGESKQTTKSPTKNKQWKSPPTIKDLIEIQDFLTTSNSS